MSELQMVKFLPAPIPTHTTCLWCAHPLAGATPDALMAALLEHAAYVNATKDRTTDAHFEEQRMNALLAS